MPARSRALACARTRNALPEGQMPPKRKRAQDETESPVPPAELDRLAAILDVSDTKAIAEFLSLRVGWRAVRRGIAERDGRLGWIMRAARFLAPEPRLPLLLCAVILRGDVEGAATIAEITLRASLSVAARRSVWDAFCESHPPGMFTVLWDLLPYNTPRNACEHGSHILSPAFPCCGKVFPERVHKEAFRVAHRMARRGDMWATRGAIALYTTHGRPDLAARLPVFSCDMFTVGMMLGACRAGYCDAYYERVIRPRAGRRMQTRTQRPIPSRLRVTAVVCGHAERSFARLQAHGLLETGADAEAAILTVAYYERTLVGTQVCTMIELLSATRKELLSYCASTRTLEEAIGLYRERRRAELVPLLAAVLPVQDIPEAIADLADALSS